MKRYLVGGAVRDRLLGLPVHERDWVVVGETPESMVARGFVPVGRDFPVFLHPQTREEHALARTERKQGRGYHGFVFHTGPEVTLEEDLRRRDLTINAIAEDEDGRLIDPCGGLRDLEARVLRHISDAFAEDPVRVLRVARFAARLAPLGFVIAPETMALMRRMVSSGEVDALVPERVWQETSRALMAADPWRYFTVLRECGALAVLVPEVDALFGVPQPARYHPEIDAAVHVGMTLAAAQREGEALEVRFALLCHDLGKGVTPRQYWPSHRGHERTGLPLVERVCARWRVPGACRDLAMLVCAEHLRIHRARELRPTTLLALLERLDALRRPRRFAQVLAACRCDARGRKGHEDDAYPQEAYLLAAREQVAAVRVDMLDDRERLDGPAIGKALRAERLRRLSEFVAAHRRGA